MAYTLGLLRLQVTWLGYLDNLDLRFDQIERGGGTLSGGHDNDPG